MSFFGPFANTISGHPNVFSTNLGASSITPSVAPPMNLPRNFNIGSLFGMTSNGAVTVGSLKAGSIETDTINNINISEALDEVYTLTVDGTYDQVLAQWDYNTTSTFGKTVKLMKTYHDVCGTRYALIKTTYNWNLNNDAFDTTDTTVYDTMFRTSISQNLGVKDIYEVVVIGFTFAENSSRILIPNYVQLPASSDDVSLEDISYKIYYPVREIWACFIYAATQSNSTVHLLSINELTEPSKVLNVPAALIAPYIEKVSLKRRIDNNVWFFSGICPRMLRMPNLRKIVGVSCVSKAPVLSGCNTTGRNLLEINLPTLREIKNCVFASGNNSLSTVHLPSLSIIRESIFMAFNPALTELYFPLLDIVQGCDFFLAQDVNLEVLKIPSNVWYQPHIPISGTATDQSTTISNTQSYINILNALYSSMGLNPVFSSSRRYNGTNSMGYFLYKDSKLLNVNIGTTNIIDNSKGIFATYPGNYGIGVYMTKSTAREFSPVETLEQFRNRISRENNYTFNAESTFDGKFTVSGMDKMYYYIDSAATGVVVYESDQQKSADSTAPVAKTVIVCPIDPRTAFMNTISTYMNSDATSVISIHTPTASKFLTDGTTQLNILTSNYYGMMFGLKYVIVDSTIASPVPFTQASDTTKLYKE